MDKKPTIAERIVDFLARHPGRHRTSKIAEAIGATASATSKQLSKLAKNGGITKIQNGTYSGNDNGDPSVSQQTVSKNISALRAAEANGETINILLSTYDIVLASYQSWIIKHINKDIDFEKQLLFIENFKWLTAIADKLMKRWSLEHVGYDTNTRQAQEDAKAKTAEREKAALENAPLQDRIMIVGKYDPEAEELIDCIPSSLKSMTDEEKEGVTV